MRTLKIFKNLLITIMFVSLVCSACKKITGNDGPLPDDECDGYPLNQTGEIGKPAPSCHFEVTVHWAKYSTEGYLGPRVKVYATIKLVRSKNGKGASIFTDCFYLKDNEGNSYKYKLPSGDEFTQCYLSEGEQISGSTTIRVDKNASGFIVIFQESKKLQHNVYKDRIRWHLGF